MIEIRPYLLNLSHACLNGQRNCRVLLFDNNENYFPDDVKTYSTNCNLCEKEIEPIGLKFIQIEQAQFLREAFGDVILIDDEK